MTSSSRNRGISRGYGTATLVTLRFRHDTVQRLLQNGHSVSMAERKRAGLLIAGAAVLALAAFGAAWVLKSPPNVSSQQQIEQLEAVAETIPAPPVGAVVAKEATYEGDYMDSATVWVAYEFSGDAREWKQHYRLELRGVGWREVPIGNIPGQIVNFEKDIKGRTYTIAITGPALDPYYTVHLG
jgi:hypothetical protein